MGDRFTSHSCRSCVVNCELACLCLFGFRLQLDGSSLEGTRHDSCTGPASLGDELSGPCWGPAVSTAPSQQPHTCSVSGQQHVTLPNKLLHAEWLLKQSRVLAAQPGKRAALQQHMLPIRSRSTMVCVAAQPGRGQERCRRGTPAMLPKKLGRQ